MRGVDPTGWMWRLEECPSPSCRKSIIEIAKVSKKIDISLLNVKWELVHPARSSRGPVPPQVPESIANDYIEASNVLAISPKSSAALSRRCLQAILHSNGYKDRDLYREVNKLLDESDPRKAIPDSLRMSVDGIRHFGNFSAHPITDVTSLQVIDVEPHEAEWCLDILDELMQHFYVRPAIALARRAELDAKLLAAGKPPSK